MADRSALLTESDGPDGGNDDSLSSLPAGLSGQNIDLPPSRDNRGGQDEGERFEIVETDSHYRPLSEGGEDGAQPRGDEERSTEQSRETAQQRREREDRRERRDRQRQGRDRTIAENARLRAEVEELRQWRQQFEPQVSERLTEFDQARHQSQIPPLTAIASRLSTRAWRCPCASLRRMPAITPMPSTIRVSPMRRSVQ